MCIYVHTYTYFYLQNINVELFHSMDDVMQYSTEDVWAVIEIFAPDSDDTYTAYSNNIDSNSYDQCLDTTLHTNTESVNSYRSGSDAFRRLHGHQYPLWQYDRPQLTIRMHPIAIPDTRSYR
jgi:hypothetical protein